MCTVQDSVDLLELSVVADFKQLPKVRVHIWLICGCLLRAKAAWLLPAVLNPVARTAGAAL